MMTARKLLTVVTVLMALLARPAASDQQRDFENAITLSSEKLEAGLNAEALASAQKAIDILPSRFEGYYFAAVALLRQKLPDFAERYAQQALERAPSDRRAAAQEVLTTTLRRRELIGIENDAAAAQRNGETRAAAVLYLRGFELDPTRADLGRNALQAWITIDDKPKIARTLRLVQQHGDATARAEATRRLAEMGYRLLEISRDTAERGWRALDQAMMATAVPAGFADAAELFQQSIDADPQGWRTLGPYRRYEVAYVGLAVARLGQRDFNAAFAALSLGARNGFLLDSPNYLDRTANGESCSFGCRRAELLAPFLCQPDLGREIWDLYGPISARALDPLCAPHLRLPTLVHGCFFAEKPDKGTQACLCVWEYDPVTRLVQYSFRIRGAHRVENQSDWSDYRYDAQTSIVSPPLIRNDRLEIGNHTRSFTPHPQSTFVARHSFLRSDVVLSGGEAMGQALNVSGLSSTWGVGIANNSLQLHGYSERLLLRPSTYNCGW